jgi:Arc/MetJ-type ribon-helix-helix transcriptional regulator
MSEGKETRAVNLPAELHGRIEQRVRETGFDSVDEYVIFVMEEVLKDEDEEQEMAFSKEEEEEVKKRLKALGYLD